MFLVDGSHSLQNACHRHGLDFRYEKRGNRNAIERIFREIKRRTICFSNCFSNAEAELDSDVAIDDALRSAEIPPPALTKAGGRSVMKRLTEEAGIDLEEGEYLKPHGARRALGAELYEKGHSELAQSALRHKSIETTHESYSDIQAKDVAEGIDEVRE